MYKLNIVSVNLFFLNTFQGFGFHWQAVSEEMMFEYYGNVHVYCPRWGHMSPWGPVFFSESLIFSPTAHFLQDFHFKRHFQSFPHSNALATHVDLAGVKIGQGHHRVMIYIYIVVLEASMLHAKSFVEICPLVLEKKIFEGFLPYMGMGAILVM